MQPLNYLRSSFGGQRLAQESHRSALQANPSIKKGVARLEELRDSSEVYDSEQPVFVFSAGWRSGSTLLQRLLMSDPGLFIWGESYDHCGLVQSLAATVKAFNSEWPPERYYYDGSPKSELAGRWIADLYPHVGHLREAHRAFFLQLFAEPAKQHGANRWGLKEVRLGIEHAHYLRWLFPNARFLFIYRHPLNAYRSYCGHGRSWYDRWPDRPVFTPKAFGRHWRHLVAGYLEEAEALGGLTLSYESLVKDGAQVDRIENYLGIQVDRTVLTHKVGSSDRGGKQIWVSRLEKWLLRRAVEPLASQLGYLW